MNNWRCRLALGLVFYATAKAFDWATDGLPYAPVFWLLYYGGAATVDLCLFRVVRYFVAAHLQRDIEALCIASVAANALGWALIQMADAPPEFYNALIAGLNYVLAIRLILGEGNVLDLLNHCYWRIVVLRHYHGNNNNQAQEEK
jgi:hypothetical protein